MSNPSGNRSDQAFLAVLDVAKGKGTGKVDSGGSDLLTLPGVGTASIKTSAQGKRVRIDLQADDPAFIKWLDDHASEVIVDVHERWKALKG